MYTAGLRARQGWWDAAQSDGNNGGSPGAGACWARLFMHVLL